MKELICVCIGVIMFTVIDIEQLLRKILKAMNKELKED